MSIIVFRKRWKHHTSKSGYDNVMNGFENNSNIQLLSICSEFRGQGILAKVLSWFISVPASQISIPLLITEIVALYHIWLGKVSLVHFTLLQHNLLLLSNAKLRKDVQIMATMHLPPVYWKDGRQRWDNFAFLNEIIVLDEYSKHYFEQSDEYSGKVTMIPHAVDTEYFVPNAQIKNKEETLHCLFVGNFLRDIKMLADVIKLAEEQDCKVLFHVVYPKNKFLSKDQLGFQYVIEKYNCVKFYDTYVSDEQLLELYQYCDLMLLPLEYSTANNSILEGIACGLPIITSNVDGVQSYLNKRNSILCGTKEAFIEAITLCLSDADMVGTMSEESRKQATKFSIGSVNEQLLRFFLNR